MVKNGFLPCSNVRWFFLRFLMIFFSVVLGFLEVALLEDLVFFGRLGFGLFKNWSLSAV